MGDGRLGVGSKPERCDVHRMENERVERNSAEMVIEEPSREDEIQRPLNSKSRGVYDP